MAAHTLKGLIARIRALEKAAVGLLAHGKAKGKTKASAKSRTEAPAKPKAEAPTKAKAKSQRHYGSETTSGQG